MNPVNIALRIYFRFTNAPLPVVHVLQPRQGGQGMVEYALILVLVSIVVIVVLITMGRQIRNVFSNVAAALG